MATKKKTTKPTKPAVEPTVTNVPVVEPKTPNPDGLHLVEEFDATARWMALPRKERDPATQWDFATKLGISPDTISDWKKLPEFWARVDAYRQDWVKDEISDVVSGLIKKAKYGSAAEVKLFLQFAGAFTESTKVEHTGEGLKPTVIYLPANGRDSNTTPQSD